MTLASIDSSGELTEQQAFDAILQWSQDRPPWQRDALRRLVLQGTLTEKDIAELTAICCTPAAVSTPLAKEHLRAAGVSGEAVSLLRVVEPTGINALPRDQQLEFAKTGLTIIYGDNGSGKSGYVRVLKHACRTRDGRTGILRDIEDKAGTPQSARIIFMRGNSEETFAWTPDTPPHPELPSVSIFDTRSANIHVEKTNAVAYIPEPMQILEALAAACDAIKGRIDAETFELKSQTPRALKAPSLSSDTAAGAFVCNLSAKSNPKQLDLLATLSEAEAKRLAEIDSDLAQDPKKVVARLQTQRNRLQSLKSSLTKLYAAVTEASFTKRDSLRAEWDRKSQAARLASDELFRASPLPDVGQDIWRALWESARHYSDQVAYPTKTFPEAVAEKDLCVLCQQPLTQEAVDRRQTFEGFVRGSTKAEEEQAAKTYNAFVLQATSARLRTQVRREGVAFFEAEIGDEALAVTIRKVTTVAAWRLRAFVKGGNPTLPAHAFPESECNALDAALSLRITQLSADEKSPERIALLKEHRELKDRQALRPLLEDIKAEIVRRQQVAQLEKAAKDTAKRRITDKNKELSDKLITNALRSRFVREVDKLKLSRMPVGGLLRCPRFVHI